MIALLFLLATSASGADTLERFECARCHEVPGATPVDDAHHCTRCHQQIAAGVYPADPDLLRRWQHEIQHLRDLPTLDGLSRRVRRSWIEAMLLHPADQRPSLEETMPRLPLTPSDARAIARALVREEPDERPVAWPERATVPRGRVVFAERCGACHRLGALDLRTNEAPPLAPDLVGVREKMTPRSLAAWIANPRAFSGAARMPALGLDDDDRLAVTRFLVEGVHEAAANVAAPARLPVLERRVGWDEVNERVFRKSCWHCHSDPDLAGGDGGPGNTGGFGYAGRGLSFASFSEALAGSRDDTGTARSVLRPLAEGPFSGTPRLVAHLLARHDEARGPIDPAAPLGMPLGLPPLSAADIQLVETWVVQGAPR